MTAADLLRDLERRDVRLALRGDRLQVDAPQGAITYALRQDLKARKPQLITLIRARDSAATDVKAEVAAMSIDEFAQAGLIVHVHSEVLGCEVLFVSDNVADTELKAEGLAIYRADELRKLALLRPNPDRLRRIHEVKHVFKGTIAAIEDRRNHESDQE